MSNICDVLVARCNWCGTWKGDKVCSKCRTVRYCSEKHQVSYLQRYCQPASTISCILNSEHVKTKLTS